MKCKHVKQTHQRTPLLFGVQANHVTYTERERERKHEQGDSHLFTLRSYENPAKTDAKFIRTAAVG